MSEVDRQSKRIQNLLVSSGIEPTVLDLTESELENLIEELKDHRHYPRARDPARYREAMLKGFDLFGVRFVKGRV